MPDPTRSTSVAELSALLTHHTAAVLGLAPGDLDGGQRFAMLGLDSVGAVALARALSQALGRRLSPTLVWEHPTIDALAQHLAGAAEAAAPAAPRRAQGGHEPVAIVGVACRFPGDSDGPERFWRALCDEVDGVIQTPAGRWDMDRWYDPDKDAPGKLWLREAGFLREVDRFDAAFFEISPREANQTDPQQRLALELAWEALESAGVPPRGLAGRRVGVYMGAIWRDYSELAAAAPEGITQHSGPGQALDVIANRVSYALGLMGPSLAVDTACSSSLVAVHLAARALLADDCELALAGGVNLMLAPTTMVAVCKLGALAPDGRCKAFGARADGFGRGEGGGVVVLKRLSRALADGDPIFAVIRGSAVNNDGASNGLTAPNPRAQEEVFTDAWAAAGLDPARATYIEAHGTGTPLGDPIEARALAAVFTRPRPDDAPPLLVGSAKTNLGHLEAAAGIAGCIKAALALHRRQIPASLHFDGGNPHIPFDELRLEVPTARVPWRGDPLAGVNSFGWGGTNCHLILQAGPDPDEHLLLLADADPTALAARALALADALARDPWSAPSLCAAAARDARGPARLAVRVPLHDGAAAAARLRAAAEAPRSAARRPVVWVMQPQGGQWQGMGAALLRDPVAGALLRRCDAHLRELGCAWSLLDELVRPSGARSAAVEQPMIVCLQMALAERLLAWGAAPDEIVGHSLGEISAAYAAGALDLGDAVRTIYHYSRLQEAHSGSGGMAVAELPAAAVAELLRELAGALDGEVGIAGRNGVASTLLTGESRALDQALAEIARRGHFGARVNTNIAGHGPQIEPLAGELHAALADLRPRPVARPWWSTSRSALLTGRECDAEYWFRNIRGTVDFAAAIERWAARAPQVDRGYGTPPDGVAHAADVATAVATSAGLAPVFVEIGPHPLLVHTIRDSLARLGRAGDVLTAARRGEPEHATLLDLARELWLAGADLRPAALLPGDDGEPRPRLLPLSAHTPAALRARARDTLELLRRADAPALDDIVYTAAVRRSHGPVRLAAPAPTREAAAAALAAWLDGQPGAGVAASGAARATHPRVVFVFPGQGSQWLGMGRELYAGEPTFRAAIDACDAAVARHGGFSVVEQLFAAPEASRHAEIDIVQPLLFSMSVALATLWRAWGIEPTAAIGHSMGEIAAAYVIGALTLDEAAAVVCRRSRLLTRAVGHGCMAIVELPLAGAAEAIRGLEGRVAVGGSNSPRTTILSGELAAIEALAQTFAARDVFFRVVRGTVPSHSPKVAFLGDDLCAALADLAPRAGRIPLCSTVTGELTYGADLGAAYWLRNLLEPVRFAQGLEQLAADGHTVFLEVSAHPVLLAPMQQTLPAGVVALGSLRREADERAALLATLGELYAAGLDPAWDAVVAPGAVVPLPLYPWQRERFWLETPPTARRGAPAGEHPLLGAAASDSLRPGARVWQTRLDRETPRWLPDHRLQEAVLLPATGFLELARAAATSALGGPVLLTDVALRSALTLVDDAAHELQTVWTPLGGDGGELRVSSREADVADAPWTLHLTARARRDDAPAPHDAPSPAALAAPHDHAPAPHDAPSPARAAPHDHAPAPRDASSAPRDRSPAAVDLPTRIDGPALYAALQAAGFHYGPTFRGLAELRRGDDVARGRVVPPGELAGELARYGLHPAVLDAALQTCLPLLGDGAWVPVAVDRCRLVVGARGELTSLVTVADRRPGSVAVDVVVRDAAGAPVAELAGLRLTRLEARGPSAAPPYLAVRWTPAPLPAADAPPPAAVLVVSAAGPRAAALLADLRARGVEVHWASPRPDDAALTDLVDRPDALEALLARRFPAARPCAAVVLAPDLDADLAPDAATPALAARVEALLAVALAAVQVLAAGRRPPRLLVVTRAATPAGGPVAPDQAPLQGLAAVLPYEHPELRTKRIDLSRDPDPGELAALAAELLHPDREDAVALRGAARLVGRFGPAEAPPALRVFPRRGRPYRLALAREGSLDGVVGQPLTRTPPGPGEVEIAVEAAGLNFFDVVRATGLVPELREQAPALGVECAGRISAVGAGAPHRVGDPVVALAPGALASHVRVRAEHAVPRPPGLAAADAAALPAALVTAWYALVHVARLAAGERVLIHCATGGTGLAALQVAQMLGAEVYATAGSPAKRALLRDLGVRHVYASRTLEFADRILADTAGEGVDVVLNSLAGAAVEESLRVLAADGRFVELGKKDVYSGRPLGLAAFKRRIGYTVVDLLGLAGERPARFAALLREVFAALADGRLRPLPTEVFPAPAADAALRKMARAEHVGKLVIDLSPGTSDLSPGTSHPDLSPRTSHPDLSPRTSQPDLSPGTSHLSPGTSDLSPGTSHPDLSPGTSHLSPRTSHPDLSPGTSHLSPGTSPADLPALVPTPGAAPPWADGTWLISGGLGGLGFSLAAHLVGRGVARVVLAGRRDPTPEQRAAIAGLGGAVEAVRLDVADPEAVDAVLARLDAAGPPLRGVVHAAVVLDDGLLRDQTPDRFRAVLAPKLRGAWNLHRATLGRELDAFVLYGSLTTPLGSPGQGNYMAANAFLDALAHHRRDLGLPALAIDWGAFADVGAAAAEAVRGQRLAARGIAGMTAAEGERWLDDLLDRDVAQMTVAILDARQWVEFHPQIAGSTWLSGLAAPVAPARTSDLRGALAAAAPDERRSLLGAFVRDQLGHVLRLPPERLDPQTPLKSLGVDSLMGLELRNRLEAGLALQLPATLIWTHPNVAALTASLLERLGLAAPPARAPEPAPEPPPPTDLDALSDDELMARLAAKLGGDPS